MKTIQYLLIIAAYLPFYSFAEINEGMDSWIVNYDLPESNANALIEYEGKLYAGTCCNSAVYVYDGTNWQIGFNADNSNGNVVCFGIYQDKLYAATDFYENSYNKARIWVYDGANWSISKDACSDNSMSIFYSLCEYNGKLYAGGGAYGKIAVFDGNSWSEAFDTDGRNVMALEVYEGKLYAGVETNGGLYCFDGSSWNQVNMPACPGVISLASNNGKLYVGTYGSGIIYVYDGDSWGLSYDSDEISIHSLISYNGNLYAGSLPNGKIYVFDETSWKVSFLSNETVIRCFGIYDGKLYAGSQQDGKIFEFVAPSNIPPIANAGENLTISTYQINETVIMGTATDPDQNQTLEYRWLKADLVLKDWQSVEDDGLSPLEICNTPLGIGSHTLVLQVSDGEAVGSDEMIITIDNSAPHAEATGGGGTYQIGTPVMLSAQVSDYDGDWLYYKWTIGEQVICDGSIQASNNGNPTALPGCILAGLELGEHTVVLTVDDTKNEPVSTQVLIKIIDTSDPTLAPISNCSILWPPNHNMVDIMIEANASDNSGSVTLYASVSSNEQQNGLGDGDLAPDWTEPVINNENGVIDLQLRSERSGSGNGRIYKIEIIAIDSSGNSTSSIVKVIVPHDKKKSY